MRSFVELTLLALVLAAPVSAAEPGPPLAADEVRFFEQEVQPILKQHCYACHSHATGKMKGGLTLDSRSGWAKGGESGPAVVPGKPQESLLYKAVRYDDDVQMPPDTQLPATAVAVIERWIKQGAPDPRSSAAAANAWEATVRERRKWWSLQPLAHPAVPAVKDAQWSQQPVDRFILARLEAANLEPAARADRRTLARRLSFALLGLPPQGSAVEEYVAGADSAQDDRDYLALVDQLLASPHFGERWARHWMDVVHYSDTHGYEWDIPAKGAWQYRDYLVRALNADVSYRQLILEHIAGDLLAEPRINRSLGLNESILGTTSLRLGERRHGDSAEFEGIHQEAIDNVIDTVSKAFQATTVACAHCHDHKLDAIAQRDYYAMAGVFMSSRWVCRSAAAEPAGESQIAELRQVKAEVKPLLAALWREGAKNVPGMLGLRALLLKDLKLEDPAYAFRALQDSIRGGASIADAWTKVAQEYEAARRERVARNQQNFKLWADFTTGELDPRWHIEGRGLHLGFAGNGDFLVAQRLDRKDADRTQFMIQHVLPAGLYSNLWSPRLGGALRSPLFTPELKGLVWEGIAGGQASRQVYVDNALFPESRFKFMDQPQFGWTSEATLHDHTSAGRRIWLELNTKTFNNYYPPRTGLVGKNWADQLDEPRSWFGVTRVYENVAASATIPQDELARFESLFAGTPPKSQEEVGQRLSDWSLAAIERWQADRADEEDVRLLNGILFGLPNQPADSKPLADLIKRYWQLEAALPLEPVVGGVADYQEARDERIGVRGSYTELGDRVPRGYVGFLADEQSFATASSGRWELAQAIASPGNPLTARVMVNRVWHYLFGAGIVATVDDFGHLGERPSDPELLDYLAERFMAEGWSIKQLVRTLVTTAAWRQSSQPSAAALEKDPDNRLWQHVPLRRLEAEELRDALLAVSGRLDLALGGPTIDPWRRAEDKEKRLLSGPLDGHSRRSLYLKTTLMEPSKLMAIFNQPVPKVTIGKRDVTNVPDQALALLNDPLVHNQAAYWSARLVLDGASSVEARVERMFDAALGRPPRDDECERLTFLANELAALHKVEGDAAVLASAAVWKDMAHAVFNLKEFLYVR